jgi:hypothetical protein
MKKEVGDTKKAWTGPVGGHDVVVLRLQPLLLTDKKKLK